MRFTRQVVYAHVGVLALVLNIAMNVARADNPTIETVPGTPTLPISTSDLKANGYEVEELFVSGQATSYKLDGAPPEDGRWQAVPADVTAYKTRIVAVRPTDPSKFNGAVLVEWLNVTSGADGGADWSMIHRELMRSGYAYVGVSAQKVGVEGGSGPLGIGGTALKKANAERYGSLNHPGDAFSFDIFSQVGKILRGSDVSKVLHSLAPKRFIAAGESQSAVFLTSYINAVDPLARTYDGFLVHSRFGSAAPLDGSTMGGTNTPKVVRFRDDLRAPVMTLITETDLFGGRLSGYAGARQPDNKNLRVWEVAGTAHADNYVIAVATIDSGSAPIEKLAAAYAPLTNLFGAKLEKGINNGPQHHYVLQAAFSHLDQWIKSSAAPPKAAPIELAAGEPVRFVLDANGNVKGGVRTPWVDVPTGRLSGLPAPGGNPITGLFGSTDPFDAVTLKRLYPGGKGEYLSKFESSLNATIKAGFILPADKKEILELAAASYRDQ